MKEKIINLLALLERVEVHGRKNVEALLTVMQGLMQLAEEAEHDEG